MINRAQRRAASFVAAAVSVVSATSAVPGEARACGCFAPPDPARPVVQAGERIVFAEKDGKVTAHIQIQYQGNADEFAWLVPVPGVPEVKVGTEELFTQIEAKTQPSFLLNQPFGSCGGGGGGFGCSSADFAAAPQDENNNNNNNNNPAVKLGAAGPFDYAVLAASDKQPMLAWLEENRYFVPGGTADAIDPYIHSGAYFLALKLRSGESTGDLQPIVLEYESQYPMIPIILTSVAATPDMGILVWVLGDARAVPRNYQHVVINEALIDWPGQAQNYGEVVRRAIDESHDHHAWVTEHAGTSELMRGVLDSAGRFGPRTALESDWTASSYLHRLRVAQFPWALLRPILERYFSVPKLARDQGLTDDQYYADIDTLIVQYNGLQSFDPVALTRELWDRIVLPTLAAGQLFRDHPYMTRLYTVLSPEEMTEDPVFSFNRDLPDVASLHQATISNTCEDDFPLELQLEDGRRFRMTTASEWSVRVAQPSATPVAARVEILREEGAAEIVVDHTAELMESADAELNGGGGCVASGRGHGVKIINWMFMFAVIALGRHVLRRWR